MVGYQSFADGGSDFDAFSPKKTPPSPYAPSPHGGGQGPATSSGQTNAPGGWGGYGALTHGGHIVNNNGRKSASGRLASTGTWTLPNRAVGRKAQMQQAGQILPPTITTQPVGRPQPTILQQIQRGLIGAGLNAIAPGAGVAYGLWNNRGALGDMFGGQQQAPVNNRPPGG